MNIDEIYNTGFAHGQSLVNCNIYDTNLKNLSSDDIEEFKERVRILCWEVDENVRQYSPFEFFCHDMNSAENSEEAWEAYEEGIGDGINAEIDYFCEELDFEEYLNSCQ